MNTLTDQRPEIQRLARLLRVEPSALTFLADVDDGDLRAFRLQVTDSLFDANIDGLRRLAAASKLLPIAITAKIAESVFTPLLSARLAGELEPERAIAIAKKLPLDVLTEVSVSLDPRRTEPVIAGTADDMVAAIGVKLAERGDWLTMGRFVGYLADSALTATMGKLTDRQIAQIAYVTEDLNVTPHIVELLGKERLSAILAVAVDEGGLLKLSSNAAHLRADQHATLVDALADAGDKALRAAAEAVRPEMLDVLLPALAELPAESQDQVAGAVGAASQDVRDAAKTKAGDLGLTDKLGPIANAL